MTEVSQATQRGCMVKVVHQVGTKSPSGVCDLLVTAAAREFP